MFDVGEFRERKTVAVTHLETFDPGDRRMTDDDAIPLPRHRGQAEKSGDDHAVRACVGHQGNPTTGVVDPPHRQFARQSFDAALTKELGAAGSDPVDELAHRLGALHTAPPFVGRQHALLPECSLEFLGRGSMPDRVAQLLEPVIDPLVESDRPQQGCSGLPSADQRRTDDLVPLLLAKTTAGELGLPMAPLGERRIADVETVLDPLGLTMSYENDLHDDQSTSDDVTPRGDDGHCQATPAFTERWVSAPIF